MIIRATKKILNTSGIKAVKNLEKCPAPLPGEWYTGLLSMGRPGKTALHYLHYPTMISILVPGKSLLKALPSFRERAADFLSRNGYGQLVFQYQLQGEAEIYTTNSRRMLAFMNHLKLQFEYHFMLAEQPEDINYSWLEDLELSTPFTLDGSKRKYTTSKKVLEDLIQGKKSI